MYILVGRLCGTQRLEEHEEAGTICSISKHELLQRVEQNNLVRVLTIKIPGLTNVTPCNVNLMFIGPCIILIAE